MLNDLPAAKQISSDEQYSLLAHEAVARQVEGDWQVRDPPLVNSLQDVRPGNVEQSDVTAQIT